MFDANEQILSGERSLSEKLFRCCWKNFWSLALYTFTLVFQSYNSITNANFQHVFARQSIISENKFLSLKGTTIEMSRN